MALILLDQSEVVDYVPEFDRKNTEDPLIIRCKYVPRKVALDFTDKSARAMRGINELEKRVAIERACNKEQFMSQVVEVKNFIDGEGNPITDPGIFYDSVDSSLVFEILDAMVTQSKLTEGQRKNLPAGSDINIK